MHQLFAWFFIRNVYWKNYVNLFLPSYEVMQFSFHAYVIVDISKDAQKPAILQWSSSLCKDFVSLQTCCVTIDVMVGIELERHHKQKMTNSTVFNTTKPYNLTLFIKRYIPYIYNSRYKVYTSAVFAVSSPSILQFWNICMDIDCIKDILLATGLKSLRFCRST